MSGFLNGVTSGKDLPVKRFGYLLSALLVVLSNIGLVEAWPATPWLFLITMYFLTGSLWIPALIRPFYKLIGRHIIKPLKEEQDKPFNPN